MMSIKHTHTYSHGQKYRHSKNIPISVFISRELKILALDTNEMKSITSCKSNEFEVNIYTIQNISLIDFFLLICRY